jgi:predicted transcriptional regulator of viral defense system
MSASSIDRLRELGSVFRASDARAAGVSWRDLYRLRDDGEVLALSRGVYQLAERSGLGSLDFVTVCFRAPDGTICLDSALAYWDLTDDAPRQVHLAVRKGATRPRIDYPPTEVHVFNADTFDVGRTWVEVDDGEGFWITDRERTVVDTHRLRHQMGSEVAAHALRRYLGQPRSRIPQMIEYARTIGTDRPLVADLQLLMA